MIGQKRIVWIGHWHPAHLVYIPDTDSLKKVKVMIYLEANIEKAAMSEPNPILTDSSDDEGEFVFQMEKIKCHTGFDPLV